MTEKTYNSLGAWLEELGAESLEDVSLKKSPTRNYCASWENGRPQGDSGIPIHWFLLGTDTQSVLLNISKSGLEALTLEETRGRGRNRQTVTRDAFTILREGLAEGLVIKNFLDDEGQERWCLQKSGGIDVATSHVGKRVSEL